MIRILHVLGNLNRGGAESFIMSVYRNIDRSKVQFDFMVHTEEASDFDDEVHTLGGKIYRVPAYNGFNHFTYIRCWKSFFKNNKNHVLVHGHIRSTASIYLSIAKKFNKYTIAHSHSTSSGQGVSAVVKNVLQYPIRHIADSLFACSYDAGKWLYGKKIDKKSNFYIINNGIETKKYVYNPSIRREIREKYSLDDKFVIGHVGRFQYPKNHSFLLEVFKIIHVVNKKSVLMLVGEGELRKEIEQKALILGLADSIIFTGMVSNVEDYYQGMDLFVFPSLFEGLGIAVIEAQAAGLRCIVSDKVPIEAKITTLVETIALKETKNVWAKNILSIKNYERKNQLNEIYEKNYDIFSVAKYLEKFYLANYKAD